MAHLIRLLAVGTAALAVPLLLVAPLAAAAPSTAAADSAAGFLVARLVDGDHLTSEFGDESITADAVLALAAANRPTDTAHIDAMVGYLADRAAAYATTPEAAAKLTLVALATGADPAAFGGVDLPAAVAAGVQPDGSFGAFPGPYASGLGLIALARTGSAVPDTMADWLLAGAAEGGGWGYAADQPAEADSTGMALLGLSALPDPSPAATEAIDGALAWAAANRRPDGSWPGFAPVNSTATLGSALLATGLDQPEAIAYLTSLQLSDGGLPTGAEPTTGADLLATAQATLLLSGSSYLTEPGDAAGPPPATNSLIWWGLVLVLAAGVGVLARVQRQ